MQIQIITVGKIKDKYLKLGIEEFSKRLGPYCKLQFDELADEQAPENMSEKEIEQVKNREGEKILQKVKDHYHVIALAIEGPQWSSEKLAKELDQLATYGKSQITFIIGGSNGLSKNVFDRSDQLLSFSKMTFPHQLMKLILLEQIYRAFKIQKGEPYHK